MQACASLPSLQQFTAPTQIPDVFAYDRLPSPIEQRVFPLPPGKVVAVKRNRVVILSEHDDPVVLVLRTGVLVKSLSLICPIIRSRPVTAAISDRQSPDLVAAVRRGRLAAVCRLDGGGVGDFCRLRRRIVGRGRT